jgi:iron-sulfur cluster assembly protein
MDCGTCEVATVVEIQQPDPVQATVSVTDAATQMLSEVMGCKDALLVGVLSGGCSGYMYDLQIIDSHDPAYQELEVNGFRILIPKVASHLLDGIEIDYIDQLMGGGFKINNPNANASCGCGESFS